MLQDQISELISRYNNDQRLHTETLEKLAQQRDFAKANATAQLQQAKDRITNLQKAARSEQERITNELEAAYQKKVLEARQSMANQLGNTSNRQHELEILMRKMPSEFINVAPAPITQIQPGWTDDAYLDLLSVMYEYENATMLKKASLKKRALEAAATFHAMVQAELLNVQKTQHVAKQGVDLAALQAEHKLKLETALRAIDTHEGEEVDRAPFDEQMRQADAIYNEQAMQEEERYRTRPSFEQTRSEALSLIMEKRRSLGTSPEDLSQPYALATQCDGPCQTPLLNIVLDPEGFALETPYVQSWDSPDHLWFYVDDEDVQEDVLDGFRSIVCETLRTVPFDGLRIFWLDPSQQGMTVCELASLAKDLPGIGPILTRATTGAQVREALEQLEQLQAEVGEKIAPYKGGVREYNEMHPYDPIPYTLIIINDITHPSYDSRIRSMIGQRMRNAARMGMQALVLSNAYEIGSREDEVLDEMREKFFRTIAEVQGGQLFAQQDDGSLANVTMLGPEYAGSSFVQSYVQACEQEASRPTPEPEAKAMPNLDEVPVYPSSEGIEVPIGFYSDGTIASLKFGSVLGGQYAQYAHGIITGGTGSGKTTFIRNLIQSACSHYSPEEFELWLVDYKAEMTTFCDLGHRFPQFGLIGLDRSVDFTKGFMDFLDKEYERRRALVSVPSSKGLLNRNDISDYNAWARENGEPILPRLLIIVDEFHVQSNYMKPPEGFIEWRTQFEGLLREVRSFGINILLVDQDINGLSGLTESGQKQLGLRATVGVNPGSAQELRTLFGSANNIMGAIDTAASMKHQALIMDLKTNSVSHVTQLRDCDWNSIANAVTTIEGRYPGQRREAQIYNANNVIDVPLDQIHPSGEDLYPVGTTPSFINPNYELRLPNKSRQNVFAMGSADALLPFDVISLMAYTAWKSFDYRVCVIGVEDCNIYDETYDAWQELNEEYMDDEIEFFESVSEINGFLGKVDELQHTIVVIVGFDELDATMSSLPPRTTSQASTSKTSQGPSEMARLTALFSGKPLEEEEATEEVAQACNDMPNVYKLLNASKDQDVHVLALDDSFPNWMKIFRDERRREFGQLFPHAFATKTDALTADFPPIMKAAGRSLDEMDARRKLIYLDPRKSAHTVAPYRLPWDDTLRGL